jgi:hypothetical protein
VPTSLAAYTAAAPCSAPADAHSLVARFGERRCADESPASHSTAALVALRGWCTSDVFAEIASQLIAQHASESAASHGRAVYGSRLVLQLPRDVSTAR